MATIQGVYVALFGRPADPLGLAYFNAQTQNGADLTAIGDLAATAEYQARFEGMTSQQIITEIYQSLFNRNPELAGLQFFVTALDNGTLTINNIAIAILDGAQGDDLATVNNKIAAADAFTAAIDTPDEIAAYQGDAAIEAGINFLDPITDDEDTIPDEEATDDAIEAIVENDANPQVPGDVFALTDALGEVVVGTSANDTITAVLDGLDNADGTLNIGDSVDGGLGTDTLNLFVVGADETDLPAGSSVEGVEIINVDQSSTFTLNNGESTDGVGFDALDASAFVGATQVWQIGEQSVGTIGLATGVTAGFRDITNLNVDVEGTGSATSVSVALDGITNFAYLDVYGDDVVSVNVSGDADDDLDIDGANAADIENINVSLTSDSDVTVQSVSNLMNFDASGSTGSLDVYLDNTNYTELSSVSLGAGSDYLDLYLDNGDEDLVVDLAAGSDYLYLEVDGNSDEIAVEITLGAGSDTVYFYDIQNVESDAEADIESQLITITDFGDEDIVDLSNDSLLLTAAVNGVVNDDDNDTLLEVLNGLAVEMDNSGDSAAIFEFDSSTYIYFNTNDDEYSTGDGLVELVGYTDGLSEGTNLLT